MLVSWNWLKEYVALAVPHDEVANRLMMAGLNHESTEAVGDDFCIDLEVTSNRPDCLGHIGVAREAAVLFGGKLTIPKAEVQTGSSRAGDLIQVRIDAPELCPRYTARVIRGVKIAASPAWLAQRLQAVGIGVVNNVVDVTNFVLMESGQPLHAFDLSLLKESQIVVRRANKNEQFTAIDHKTYALDEAMCVIADAERPVALGGVMGGAESEVSPGTRDLLIESAIFAPLSIRTTARKLNLRSPSSYRFERGVDPEGVDWSSRRCCELILDLAGGELAEGVVDIGPPLPPREPIVLRLAQLARILGIEVPPAEVRRILTALGCVEQANASNQITTIPPSWRRDVTREIDLVEEVARIHGYDKIPEDARVPMAPSHRTDADRVLQKVRHVLTAAGFDEAYTASLVPEKWSSAFSPWTDAEPLQSSTPMLKGADRARRSIVPSLLEARRVNESLSNSVIELFETARIYLPQAAGLPSEQPTLAAVSGQGFLYVKGVVEALLATLIPGAALDVANFRHALLDSREAGQLQLAGERLGFLGQLSAAGLKAFGLRGEATILELDIGVFNRLAVLVPKAEKLSDYPAITRDLNLIVDEAVRWADLAATVRAQGGEHLEGVVYKETYRQPEQKDGPDKKRLIFTLAIRSRERTLTSEEADHVRDTIIAACGKAHGARLLG
jgi:phenylalanyl-tRNA synthetase beta chain